MDTKATEENLRFVVFGEDAWRLRISKKKGELFVSYDVHGQSIPEAKRNITNIINASRIPFSLEIVHGYRHGSAIKEMIANELNNKKIKRRYTVRKNKGVTYFLIE